MRIHYYLYWSLFQLHIKGMLCTSVTHTLCMSGRNGVTSVRTAWNFKSKSNWLPLYILLLYTRMPPSSFPKFLLFYYIVHDYIGCREISIFLSCTLHVHVYYTCTRFQKNWWMEGHSVAKICYATISCCTYDICVTIMSCCDVMSQFARQCCIMTHCCMSGHTFTRFS